MRYVAATAASFLLTLIFGETLVAQGAHKNAKPAVYEDAEGYQVLSSVIELRSEKVKGKSVPIFGRTIAQRSVSELLTECSSKIPVEFQTAARNLGQSGNTRYQLRRQFAIRKKYEFVANPIGKTEGVFSFSTVGFDDARNHAIVLLEHLVHPTGSMVMGGSSTFYLLRKTEGGWQEAAEIPRCGRIY